MFIWASSLSNVQYVSASHRSQALQRWEDLLIHEDKRFFSFFLLLARKLLKRILFWNRWLTKTYCTAQGILLHVCDSLDGRGVWGRMDACICMAESLCRPPETITTLLVGYIQIQNKKLKRKKIFKCQRKGTQLCFWLAEAEVWALHAVFVDTPWWEWPSVPLVGVGVPAPHGRVLTWCWPWCPRP